MKTSEHLSVTIINMELEGGHWNWDPMAPYKKFLTLMWVVWYEIPQTKKGHFHQPRKCLHSHNRSITFSNASVILAKVNVL